MDICLLRHNHPQSFRVRYNGKRCQGKFVFMILVQVSVHVIQRTDTAARDVRHNDVPRILLVQSFNSLNQCIRNIANAVSADWSYFHILTTGIFRIDDVVCTQIVGDDRRTLAGAVDVFGQRHHCGGFSGTQETAYYHESFLFH